MRYVMIPLLLALSAAPAQAQGNDWVQMTSTDSGAILYVGRAGINQGRNNRAARVWQLMDTERDRSATFREAVLLYEIDCVQRSYRQLQATVTYRDGRSDNLGFQDSRSIIPGSNFDTLRELVCR